MNTNLLTCTYCNRRVAVGCKPLKCSYCLHQCHYKCPTLPKFDIADISTKHKLWMCQF